MTRKRNLSRSISRDTPRFELVKAFHPTMFQKGIYAVHFAEKDKPLVDEFTRFTQIKAKSRSEAIKLAKEKFGITGSTPLRTQDAFGRDK